MLLLNILKGICIWNFLEIFSHKIHLQWNLGSGAGACGHDDWVKMWRTCLQGPQSVHKVCKCIMNLVIHVGMGRKVRSCDPTAWREWDALAILSPCMCVLTTPSRVRKTWYMYAICQKLKLKINVRKSKVMLFERRKHDVIHIEWVQNAESNVK